MATAQLTSVILADIPVNESGQASGLQSTFRQLGSALGVGLATGLLYFFASVYRNADGSPLFVAQMDPTIVLSACAIAIVVGLAAAALPARRAARMDPVQAIRM